LHAISTLSTWPLFSKTAMQGLEQKVMNQSAFPKSYFQLGRMGIDVDQRWIQL
jgi:hypothetical protein